MPAVDMVMGGCLCHQVCSAAVEPDVLFAGAESEEPLVDLEGLQFESAAEGTMQSGSVHTVMRCVHLDVEHEQ
jgi:hypothetical protein